MEFNMNNNLIKKLENRGGSNPPPKKKFNFKLYKNNTLKSLNDVEYFLNNFHKIVKSIKLYKILK